MLISLRCAFLWLYFFVFILLLQVNARPNVIIMLMDDMGYGDLGITGDVSRETPNLDKMAKEGILLTDMYAANPLCSPSRASLLTGRLPIRNGFYTDNTDGRNSYTPQEIMGGISDQEILLPELLSSSGYYTKLIGKWHLGHKEEYLPTRHGFREFFGSTNCHFGPYDNINTPNIAFFQNDSMIGRYYEEFEINLDNRTSNLTQLYIKEALNFLHRFASSSNNEPFFLLWAPDATHGPAYRSLPFVNKSKKQNNYGDAVIELDDGVGQILDLIRSSPKLANNTLVFFTSDNGAALIDKSDAGSNLPFVCGKQTTFEGGIREPTIAWWPGQIESQTISSQVASLMDLFNTILYFAQIDLPNDRKIDGINLASTLINGTIQNRALFHYRGNRLMAIRSGPYKAHFWTWTNSWEQFAKGIDFCPGVEITGITTHEMSNYTLEPKLFHLNRDPSEKYQISASSSEYKSVMPSIMKLYHSHSKNLKPGKPQLNWCDKAAMHWSPPGCAKINKCLPVPDSKPYRCDWPH